MPNNEPKPRTPAQIEASRRNGAKSRGPKSAPARARSSQNSLKHGLTANIHCVINQEDQRLFNDFLDQYVRAYLPADHAEHQLVLDIAKCAWRLNRISNIEASLFNLEIEGQRERVDEQYNRVAPHDRIAIAFSSICCLTHNLTVLSRYETACRRGLLNLTAALARMQADRRRLSAQASRDTQPGKLRNEPGRTAQVIPIPLRQHD